jgi:fructosamine-3-kinase
MTQTALTTSEPQRLRALERANQIRLARASLKRGIALGRVSAAEVIRNCPDEAHSWPIGELLMSQHRWGNAKCRRFLNHNQIPETKAIGTLTERQRQMLASSLQDCVSGEMELVGR